MPRSSKPVTTIDGTVFPPSPAKARALSKQAIGTTVLHGSRAAAPAGIRPLAGSIVQSTSYAQSGLGTYDGPTYSRVANPSVDELEAFNASFIEYWKTSVAD